MRRRSQKSDTPLTEKQQALARQEAKLHEDMQKLERMIAEAPRVAEARTRQQRADLLERASHEGSRLDVSMTLQDKRFGDRGSSGGRRVSLRKERREGRFVFLFLVIALLAAVIWLFTHLRF